MSFQQFILLILEEKHWKERSSERNSSTMETLLREWCNAEQWMQVEKLILFNQEVSKWRHCKWVYWWLMSWSLMHPLPSIYILVSFRPWTLKKGSMLYAQVTTHPTTWLFIRKRYTHISIQTKDAVSLALCDRHPEVSSLHTAAVTVAVTLPAQWMLWGLWGGEPWSPALPFYLWGLHHSHLLPCGSSWKQIRIKASPEGS